MLNKRSILWKKLAFTFRFVKNYMSIETETKVFALYSSWGEFSYTLQASKAQFRLGFVSVTIPASAYYPWQKPKFTEENALKLESVDYPFPPFARFLIKVWNMKLWLTLWQEPFWKDGWELDMTMYRKFCHLTLIAFEGNPLGLKATTASYWSIGHDKRRDEYTIGTDLGTSLVDYELTEFQNAEYVQTMTHKLEYVVTRSLLYLREEAKQQSFSFKRWGFLIACRHIESMADPNMMYSDWVFLKEEPC